MIKIEITDPQGLDKATLRAMSALMLTLAGDNDAEQGRDVVNRTVTKIVKHTMGDRSVEKTTIEPADSPDVGSPTTSDAAQAFGDHAHTIDTANGYAVTFDASANYTGEAPPVNPAAAFGSAGNSPAVNAPVVASAPAQNTGSALVDVDRDGLPWDARIHASSKVKNADGKWRVKRGVDDALIAQVTAELRQVAAIPTPDVSVIAAQVQAAASGNVNAVGSVAPVPAAIPTVTPQSIPAIPHVEGNVPTPPVAGIPAAPTVTPSVPATSPAIATPAEVATAPSGPMDYATFIGKVTAGLTANPPTMTQAAVQATLSTFGVPGLPLLATRPDLVPAVAAALGIA